MCVRAHTRMHMHTHTYSALAASSKGRLIRGDKCTELLPASAAASPGVGGWSSSGAVLAGGERDLRMSGPGDSAGVGEASKWAATLNSLGIETVFMGGEYDFSGSPPPKGYMLLTPASLLNLLVSDKAARPDVGVLTAAQKQALLLYLISPLEDSRQITPVLQANVPEAETQALVLSEDREKMRARAIRNICCLALHRQVILDEGTAADLAGGNGLEGSGAGVGGQEEGEPLASVTPPLDTSSLGVQGEGMVGVGRVGGGKKRVVGTNVELEKFSFRYSALVESSAGGEEAQSSGGGHTWGVQAGKQRGLMRRGERLPGGPRDLEDEDEDTQGDGKEEEACESVQECARLLGFGANWALLKDSVWCGQLPSGSLALSKRRFLCVTPGTAWFYRHQF